MGRLPEPLTLFSIACVFVSLFVFQFPNKTVALVASDILHLLINYVDDLQKFPLDTPKKIVEVNLGVHFYLCIKVCKLFLELFKSILFKLQNNTISFCFQFFLNSCFRSS